jgi:hypothetical protein
MRTHRRQRQTKCERRKTSLGGGGSDRKLSEQRKRPGFYEITKFM